MLQSSPTKPQHAAPPPDAPDTRGCELVSSSTAETSSKPQQDPSPQISIEQLNRQVKTELRLHIISMSSMAVGRIETDTLTAEYNYGNLYRY